MASGKLCGRTKTGKVSAIMNRRYHRPFMKRISILLGVLAASIHSLSAQTYQKVPELKKCFDDAGVIGTFVLFNVATDRMLVWDEARAKKRFEHSKSSPKRSTRRTRERCRISSENSLKRGRL